MKSITIGLACIAASFAVENAYADASGARLRIGGLDIQFTVEDISDPDIRRIVFGEDGAVARTAALLKAQNADMLMGTPRDLTVHLNSGPGNTIEADLTSGSLELSQSERSVVAERSETLVAAVCEALRMQDCDVESAVATNLGATLPRAKVSTPLDGTFVLLEIGNLPSDGPENQIVVPTEDSLETFDGESVTLPAAIDRMSQDLYDVNGLELELEDGLEVASRREFFIVHCTAFGASDSDMRRWVERNKREGRRNKSHGVILPSGEWLPMWDFAERNVWATKTETCKDTKERALGSAINIELHYFCGSGRSDRATEAQYSKLADLYIENSKKYGALAVVSHREVDRGLKDGHGDPIGFDFGHFYALIEKRNFDLRGIKKISDARHGLRTGADLSHHWKPVVVGPLISEKQRADDCKRDH